MTAGAVGSCDAGKRRPRRQKKQKKNKQNKKNTPSIHSGFS